MQTIRTNLKKIASTQYTNTSFTSMCMFNGVVIGAGSGGLFKACCGDSDNGTPIDAYFIPYTTDLGSMNEKRPRAVYVGLQGDGELQLMIAGDGKRVNGPFTITADPAEGPQQRRFPINRAEGWIYGQFKFNNVDGSFFAIDLAQVLSITHQRRRR